MQLVLDHDGLLTVWTFLGAHCITSDIQLALQTHALERQFHNWLFHVLLHNQLRTYFQSVYFHGFLAHPHLTYRLQGALDLLVLRCANQNLRARCTLALATKGVRIHELLCASRPVQTLDHYITKNPRHLFLVHELMDIRTAFHRVKKSVEQEQNCEGSLNLLSIILSKLCTKNNSLRLKILVYEQSSFKTTFFE